MKRRLFAALLAVMLLSVLAVSALGAESGEYIAVLNAAPRSFQDETPYITQCELGCVIADAVREATGAQIALVPMGAIQNDLNQGEITREDVENVFTANETLALAKISTESLYEMLETAVSHVEVDPSTEQLVPGAEEFDGFCQISGFSFRYDASAPAGERVLSVTLADGTALLPSGDDVISAASTAALFEGACGFSPAEHHRLTITLADALAEYAAAHTALPTGETERIYIAGARQNAVVSMFPRGVLAIGVAFLAAFLAFTRLRSREREEDPYPEGE